MIPREAYINLPNRVVTKDPQETKSRLKFLFMKSGKGMMDEVARYSGYSMSYLTTVRTTGNLSLRCLVTVAMLAKVDPFWLAGEYDEQKPFSIELVEEYLTANGYPLSEYERASPYQIFVTYEEASVMLQALYVKHSHNDIDAAKALQKIVAVLMKE